MTVNKWTVITLLVTLVALTFAAAACTGASKNIPTPPIVVPPTLTPEPIVPTFTLAPTATLGALAAPPKETAVPLSTAMATPITSGAAVVASNEASGSFAVAVLTAVPLTPGHAYQLVVSSPAGAVTFHGEWSTSATGADGLPGVKVGLLDGTTPTTYDIAPPVRTVAKDWVYSASVQNKGEGGISLTIVDVTK
jgi:hypothetical protein